MAQDKEAVMKQLILIIACLLISYSAMAAGKMEAPNLEQLISVEIESSRPQLVAGEGLGVIARIKNVSKVPVFVKEKSFSLTVPLEMEGARAGVSGYYAYFPTEFHQSGRNISPEEFYTNSIRLNPGDTYSAFWANTFADSNTSSFTYIWQQITSQFQFLFFTPGRYSITLTAKYWTDQALSDKNYRTFTKSITVPVVAPLFVILFGAAIGGLVAHFVLPRALQKSSNEKVFIRVTREVAGMFGSALLSVIVTIILSRVSETQFLISVTVNDIWGAIVTGFAANYVGYKALSGLFPERQDDQPKAQTPAALSGI
jgi:hypothetical protein